jgi:nucleoside-diphosphate-sugar epimerase
MILVTGGTGFIGSYLVPLLVAEQGEDVVVFDHYPNRGSLADVAEQVRFVDGDVLDPNGLADTIQRFGVDRVVHLAGAPGGVLADRTVDYGRLMCIGTANVFEAARACGVRRVVNASSVAVYGFERQGLPPVDEDAGVAPTDLYGASKLWSEVLARVHNQNGELEVLNLRICSALGVGRLNRASLAAGLTTERITVMAYPELAARGEPVAMPPDDEIFDFIYAPDVARAFWLALTAERPEHSIFNLRAHQRPFGEVTALVREFVPEAQITVAEQPAGALRLRLMDDARIRTELGFEPQYSLRAAVQDYIEQALLDARRVPVSPGG